MVAVPYSGWDGNFHEFGFTVDTGATVTKGYFVAGNAGGIKNIAADGDLCIGIAAYSGTAGEKVTVYMSGVFTISAETGDDFDLGEAVYPTNDGKLIDGVSGDYSCGCALSDFDAAGSGQFYLVPSQQFQPTVIP